MKKDVVKSTNNIDYDDLGKFTEELMRSYIEGEIDSNEFIQFIHTRINQMKGKEVNMSVEFEKKLAVFSRYINQTD